MLEVPELNEPFLFWREFPRAFGTPFQRMVFTDEQFSQYLKVFNGSDICFISHNSYPDLDHNNNPLTVNVSKVFIDIDCKEKPENALLDARNLTRWAIKNDLPFAVVFSGSKGFHFYLIVKPEKYKENASLSNALYAMQKYVCTQGNTRHHDEKVWGNSKNLCRVWYTKYVGQNKDGPIYKDTFCCPLSPEMVLSMGITEIFEYAKNPKLIQFPESFGGTYLKLHELLKHFDISVAKYASDNDRGYVQEDETKEYIKPDDKLVLELFPRPCIHSQLVQDNPDHFVRFVATVRLKELGFDQYGIFDFFKSLNWIDSHNIGTMRYQIRQISNRNPPYKHPSCGRIKRENLCVGEKCPKYWKD